MEPNKNSSLRSGHRNAPCSGYSNSSSGGDLPNCVPQYIVIALIVSSCIKSLIVE